MLYSRPGSPYPVFSLASSLRLITCVAYNNHACGVNAGFAFSIAEMGHAIADTLVTGR
jgi:hypothetical protein